MNERRLRELLWETPVPGAVEAERRGRAVVEAAYAEGERADARRQPPRPSPARLALALAILTLLAALLLSPAGAAVRHWVGDVFEGGPPASEQGLTEIPGGGRLLVQSASGPWVVQPDGSRRLLGDYAEATWSPRGLFVAAASGRTLSTVEPGGTPRWSLSAPGRVSDPRWSPAGFDIAYRAGRELRTVGADGKEDRPVDGGVAPLAPAWSPQGSALLAYVDAEGRLRIADVSRGETVAAAPALAAVEAIEWGAPSPTAKSAPGGLLLESSARAVRLRPLDASKLLARIEIGAPRALPLPAGARVRDAALSPEATEVAVLLDRGGAGPGHGKILLAPTSGGRPRTLRTPGGLAELAWSPEGTRLLLARPEADQWLFVPIEGRARVRAVGDVAAQFGPGGRLASFPRVEGWCCRPYVGG